MKRFITNYTILLLIIPFCTFSQIKNTSSPSFKFYASKNSNQMPDSIVVRFWKENISGTYGSKRFVFNKKKGDVFLVNLPIIDHISMLYFAFYYGDRTIVSNMYYAEPRDNIGVDIRRNDKDVQLKFFGNGSIKYLVIDRIANEYRILEKKVAHMKDSLNFSTKKVDEDSKKLEYYVNRLLEETNSYSMKTQKILSKYNKEMSSNLFKFFSYELDNSTPFFKRYIYSIYLHTKTEQNKRKIVDFYFLKNDSLNRLDNPWLKYSYSYVLYTGYIKQLETYFSHGGNSYTFKEQFDILKEIADRDLRDRLVTELFLSTPLQGYISNFNSRDSCLNNALTFIKSPALIAALQEQHLFSKGASVYNFSFPDTLGRMISKKDLAGVVFMLEFYGEGCSGCAIFAKRFRDSIFPEFENNPNFKVVSVSVDRTRERWFKAMKSGLYTHKTSINLNTGPTGIRHPMLSFYNLNALPFILLVDKDGNLITRLNGKQSSEINRLIRNSLKEPAQDLKSK